MSFWSARFLVLWCLIPMATAQNNPWAVSSGDADGLPQTLVTWAIDTELLTPEENPCADFVITGSISREGEEYERFRLPYHPGGMALSQAEVWFAFKRNTGAAPFDLELELMDCHQQVLTRTRTRINTHPDEPRLGVRVVWPFIPVSIGMSTPHQNLYVGRIPLTIKVTGEGVATIRILLDGQETDRLEGDTYKTRIKLGAVPLLHEITAEALDSEGFVLARDRMILNRGPHTFSVELLQPLPEKKYRREVTALAEVKVPHNRSLKRLEFFLDDQSVAGFTKSPYTTALRLADEKPRHLRAVAWLENGDQSEDSVMFNPPENFHQMEIRHVGMWVGVRDRRGKPVQGLQQDDFSVWEEGEPVHLTQFAEETNLPLNIGFLVDISESMVRGMPGFAKQGREFLNILEPGDKTAVFLFHERPRLIQPLTEHRHEMVAGMERIEAEIANTGMYGTGIYQSIVETAGYFGGAKGRHALIVYTDGNDTSSAINFPHTIRFLQQSGVQVFVIVAPLEWGTIKNKGGLKRLATETGGAYFQAAFPAALGAAFREISDILRSQYLLGYQSTLTRAEDCRKIRIKLPKGLVARHPRRICAQ